MHSNDYERYQFIDIAVVSYIFRRVLSKKKFHYNNILTPRRMCTDLISNSTRTPCNETQNPTEMPTLTLEMEMNIIIRVQKIDK